MQVLLLSSNTGQGHNACAAALREEFLLRGINCDIVDALTFLSPAVSRFVCGGHVQMYRHFPAVFRRGYHYAEQHPALFESNSSVSRAIATGADRLYDTICHGGYDAVLCTHITAAIMLTSVRRLHPTVSLPCAFLATDYTCSPGVDQTDLDLYYIPSPELTEAFHRGNIAHRQIIPSGIPVRQMFSIQLQPQQAKRLCGIQPQHRHLVLMCGSMGCGPMRRLTQRLCRALATDEELSVLCGTNDTLRRDLTIKYRVHPRVHIHGYERNPSVWLDSADVYLTKPGGISTTEAAVKHTPMVLVDAVSGCEAYNLRFFTAHGAAVSAKSVTDIAAEAMRLLRDAPQRQICAAAAASAVPAHAAQTICDTLLAHVCSRGASPIDKKG